MSLKKLIFYSLVIYYNLKVGFQLLIAVLFMGKKVLEVKKHPRPAILDKYNHKTALINVSKTIVIPPWQLLIELCCQLISRD